ncbi:hypothetical protein IFM89_006720 [Coptis chinensis]|uniref:Uncharacterized protein n=1 Tax=Coptis chinensis TaxID=261450 RepID=A0A835LLK6_9MAGN|nr:hypothetical protein IFM89_006720 [Coptis chinensis]
MGVSRVFSTSGTPVQRIYEGAQDYADSESSPEREVEVGGASKMGVMVMELSSGAGCSKPNGVASLYSFSTQKIFSVTIKVVGAAPLCGWLCSFCYTWCQYSEKYEDQFDSLTEKLVFGTATCIVCDG